MPGDPDRALASMGIYVFTREVLLEILEQPGIDFGKEIIPKSLSTHRVHPYIFRGYWADVGTIEAFYAANIQFTQRGAPFSFFHPHRPIYTHQRFLPATRTFDCPSTSSRPRDGRFMPTSVLSNVDLPAPLRPISATISPRASDVLTPCNAGTGP